jgi:hypothetical protein
MQQKISRKFAWIQAGNTDYCCLIPTCFQDIREVTVFAVAGLLKYED